MMTAPATAATAATARRGLRAMAAPALVAEAEAAPAAAEREAPPEGVIEPTVVWAAGVEVADEATTVWPPVPTV